MAVNPQSFYTDLASFRAASVFPFAGVSFDQLAWAISVGMTSWAPQVKLAGVTAGTAGSGAINTPTTRVVLLPNPALVIAGLASAGVSGPLGTSLGTVVGQAIPKTISTVGQYAGASAGVGVGADVSKVVLAPGPALTSILTPLFTSFLGPGPLGPQVARGLGTGIASLMLTGGGAGSVVGPPSIAPGGGTSTSVLV